MKNLRILLYLFIAFSISSCGGAKYNFNFDKGKELNFKNGKWILNDPYTNYDNNDAYKYAKEEFVEILGDSLTELIDLRQTKMIQQQLPLNPTKKELQEIKEFSGCNFLINIDSKIVKDQLGNSEHQPPAIGTVTKYNEARSKIQIYDLDNLELVSESIVYGQVKVTKRADDDESILESIFNYTTPGRTLALNGIKKLIRKYEKYQVD